MHVHSANGLSMSFFLLRPIPLIPHNPVVLFQVRNLEDLLFIGAIDLAADEIAVHHGFHGEGGVDFLQTFSDFFVDFLIAQAAGTGEGELEGQVDFPTPFFYKEIMVGQGEL